MTNLQNQPKSLPLTLILIGTTLLAIPAGFGTLALFDTSSTGITAGELPGFVLLCISVGGFTLFAGYIMTAILRRHSSLFWLFSSLYNLALSGVYWYAIFYALQESPKDLMAYASGSPVLLLPLWTTFVTLASVYYCLFPLFRKQTDFV